jgi:hypothetical protein
MARIAESSELFRTREEICRDVAFALRTKELHFAARRAVVDQAIWVWSEYEGKFSSSLFWSKDALRAKERKEPIIHEHPVPRKEIRVRLFSLKRVSIRAVREIFETYCLGAVISKAEDEYLNRLGLRSRMPDNWNGNDVWARYRCAKINVP